MTFAEIMPHLLAGHEVTLGDDPNNACRYRMRSGILSCIFPGWDVWLPMDSLRVKHITATTWNYAPADSPPNTPQSAPAYADA